MKTDENVKMVSSDAPIILSKACELFIIDLAFSSWIHTLSDNRKTVQRLDIAKAISFNQHFDFLVDIIPESSFERKKFFNSTYPLCNTNSNLLKNIFENCLNSNKIFSNNNGIEVESNNELNNQQDSESEESNQ